MTTVIEAERLGKRYLLGEDVQRRTLKGTLSSLARRNRHRREELWSLRDVSFAVGDGESLGVIGRNGAGKTTLLRLISRITEPTEGLVRTRGRVGSLLEVGTGFHPELTGRENIYLNGAILGLRARDIERRFDEIVSFAGFERFLDTPIKRYSTGMHLRLAFAVAAHIDTSILLVDEVLAVGDGEFQRKCMTKVQSVGEEGRTVVFVSHNLDAVATLCSRSIWLDQGRVVAEGPTAEVIDRYMATGLAHRGRRRLDDDGTGPVTLDAISVLDPDGKPTDATRHDRPFSVEVEYTVREPTPGFDLAIVLTGHGGIRILDEALSAGERREDHGEPGQYRARIVVPPVLGAGDYSVNIWVGSAYEDDLIWEPNALVFHLAGNPVDKPDRVLDLGLPFEIEHIDG